MVGMYSVLPYQTKQLNIFIPLACAECDKSLLFSGASTQYILYINICHQEMVT